jgi:hypothetical protein
VEALDSGAVENVQWCLGGRRVGQLSPTDVQHVRKSTELTGGVGRGAVLVMGHSFFQRYGTLSGHLITEEGDLGPSRNTLRWVGKYPVPLKFVEENP